MQAAGAFNRPISLQPFGQVPCRAVCGVAALVDSRAIHCAPRLAPHPGKGLVQLQEDFEQVLATTCASPGRHNDKSLAQTLILPGEPPDAARTAFLPLHLLTCQTTAKPTPPQALSLIHI